MGRGRPVNRFLNRIFIFIAINREMSSLLVHHSTVAIVPDNGALDVWNRVQSLRYSLRDRGLYRWPPHINILYPFIRPVDIDITLISSVLRDQSPFEVRLQDFQTFGGTGRRGVLWLNPVTAQGNEIHQLHDKLSSVYESHPDPRIYSGFKSKPFHPHMTVCHYETWPMAAEMANTLQSDWSPLSFMVKEVLIMERHGDNGQFQIAFRIPLSGTEVPDMSKPTDPDRNTQEIPYLNERFPLLPETEEDWVREARLLAKKKSKRRSSRTESRHGTCKTENEEDSKDEGEEFPIVIESR